MTRRTQQLTTRTKDERELLTNFRHLDDAGRAMFKAWAVVTLRMRSDSRTIAQVRADARRRKAGKR